jgi:hypothetical protein
MVTDIKSKTKYEKTRNIMRQESTGSYHHERWRGTMFFPEQVTL